MAVMLLFVSHGRMLKNNARREAQAYNLFQTQKTATSGQPVTYIYVYTFHERHLITKVYVNGKWFKDLIVLTSFSHTHLVTASISRMLFDFCMCLAS